MIAVARDSDFQAAWYYSILVFAGLMLAVWGVALCVRHLRAMWRNGDHGLALTVGAAVLLATLMYLSMLVTVAIAMLPSANPGHA